MTPESLSSDRISRRDSEFEVYPPQSILFCLHVSQLGRSPEHAVFRLRHVIHAAPMRRL